MEAKYTQGYQVLSEVDNTEDICLYSAIVGRNGDIINKNDYISFEKDGTVS